MTTTLATHLDRRQLLRLAAAGVAASGTGALAAACSSTTSGARSAASSSAPPATPVPVAYDPARPYWLQGNFAPVARELEAVDLAVDGALPPGLTGLFVRNGSNPATGESPHWFLGDGMLHGLRLERGKVKWYRNRFVNTTMYAQRAGALSGPPGMANNQSNVSAFHHGGRLLTSGEVGYPYEISTADLSTIGPFDYAGGLTTAMTAHPKIDPATGKMHFFGYGFVPPYLTYHVASADGVLESSQVIDVAGPTMIHDFAITDRDAIFWELPVVFDLQAAIRSVSGDGSAFPFRWDPSYGARVGVMPLGGPASAIRWVEIEPCYVFHGTNAYRDGDKVIVDVCRQASVFREGGDLEVGATHRWTIDTSGPDLRFSETVLSDVQMDLPSIDRRHTGRAHRQGWYATIDRSGPFPFEFSGIARLDHVTGTVDRWEPGRDYRPGEGFFVAGGSGEGEGWIVTYAYDRRTDRSDFVVLDAMDMAKGSVATVHLPQRVPYGFHGVWVPG